MTIPAQKIHRIAVLKGGPSSEHEVSLRTGAAVADALRSSSRGYQVEEVVVEGRDFVLPPGVDFVFLALHGTFGEDGEVQALLEKRGIPYTGSGIASSRLAFDKEASKDLFRAIGVPTPEGITLTRGEAFPGGFPLPVVVKPARQGSTLGMSFVFEQGEIAPALAKGWEHDDRVLVESYVKGREFTVGILGDAALPLVEIAPKSGFYDYNNKYTAGATDYTCPAVLDRAVTGHIQQLALQAHRVLCCRVYSRVDVLLDGAGRPFVLEVNTIPGMTATSLLPKAAAAAGLSFVQLCERILDLSAAALPATAAPFLTSEPS